MVSCCSQLHTPGSLGHSLSGLSCLCLPFVRRNTRITDTRDYTIFTGVLGIQTQVLMLCGKCFTPRAIFPTPRLHPFHSSAVSSCVCATHFPCLFTNSLCPSTSVDSTVMDGRVWVSLHHSESFPLDICPIVELLDGMVVFYWEPPC